MKVLATLVLGLGLVSASAFGDELRVQKDVSKVHVKSAHLEPSGGRGLYDLFVDVEYSNSCMAAGNEDLMVLATLGEGRRQNLTLVRKPSNVACPAIYAPVYQTVKIPDNVDPADGVPRITVNDVEAPLARPAEHADLVELDWQANGSLIRLDSAGAHFVPSTNGYKHMTILAVATFSNGCMVPKQEDLYRLVELRDDFSMRVTVFQKPEVLRACPAIYDPVTVGMEVFAAPVYSAPESVVVNSIEAL